MPKIKKPHAFINRIHVRLGFAVALVCGIPVASFAADLPVKYDHVEYKQTGNSYKWTPLTGKTPGGNGVVFRGDTGISTAEPKISTTQRLPFDKRGDIPSSQMAKVTSPFTKANFGKALTAAGRIAWPIGVIITAGEIYDYMKGAGISDLQNTPEGIKGKMAIDSYEVSDGKEYCTNTPRINMCGAEFGYFKTKIAAANSYKDAIDIHNSGGAPHIMAQCGQNYCFATKHSPTNFVYVAYLGSRNSPCPAGSYVTPEGQCTIKSGKIVDVNQSQIEDKIAQESGWPTAAARALQSALNVPGVTIETEPPTVSGPSSIPGTKTTTTEKVNLKPGTNTPAGPADSPVQTGTKTTTSTTTSNVTYNNSTATHNTKTSTVINITNNVTNTTTTEGEKEEVKEDDDKEEEKTECEKNPDALMCQDIDLDTPDVDIPKDTKNITLQEENLFGGGACPADVYFQPSGGLQQMKAWDWNQSCGYITGYVKPVLILCCTFTAFMILVPGKTE